MYLTAFFLFNCFSVLSIRPRAFKTGSHHSAEQPWPRYVLQAGLECRSHCPFVHDSWDYRHTSADVGSFLFLSLFFLFHFSVCMGACAPLNLIVGIALLLFCFIEAGFLGSALSSLTRLIFLGDLNSSCSKHFNR